MMTRHKVGKSLQMQSIKLNNLCGFSTFETNRPASVWLDAQAFDLHRVVFCVDLITHKLPGSWQSGDHDL